MNLSVPLKTFNLDWGTIKGTWVGAPGPRGQHIIVPVRSDEPVNAAHWGVRPSASGRPIIQSNSDPTPGLLTVLSSFNGTGVVLGEIFVADADLPHIQQITVAQGCLSENGQETRWEDALVALTGRVRLYLQRTGPPDAFVEFDGKELITTYKMLPPANLSLIPVKDRAVSRWEIELRTDNAPKS